MSQSIPRSVVLKAIDIRDSPQVMFSMHSQPLWPQSGTMVKSWVPNQSIAVVIWLLSRNVDLAIVYLLSRRFRRQSSMARLGCMSPIHVALTLSDWMCSEPVSGRVAQAMMTLHHPDRVQADAFLMQSILVEFIRDQNRRGLTVDLPQAIHKYLQLWNHRDISPVMHKALSLLAWQRNSRRKFGRNLRSTWCLSQGALRHSRDLAEDAIALRVPSLSTDAQGQSHVFLSRISKAGFPSYMSRLQFAIRMLKYLIRLPP